MIEAMQPELDGDMGSGVGKVLERLTLIKIVKTAVLLKNDDIVREGFVAVTNYALKFSR